MKLKIVSINDNNFPKFWGECKIFLFEIGGYIKFVKKSVPYERNTVLREIQKLINHVHRHSINNQLLHGRHAKI